MTLDRPSLTEFATYVVVPVFNHGEAGSPEGSRGVYQVVGALGVPGRETTMSAVDMNVAVSRGDSLMSGIGLRVEIASEDQSSKIEIEVRANQMGRLSQFRMSLVAESFREAEMSSFNLFMPLVSRLAFESNTPLDIVSIIILEEATQIQSWSGSVLGSNKSAVEMESPMSPELRPLLASYREGLNSNSPLYQALSFFKVIEGVSKYHVSRTRKLKPGSAIAIPDPEKHVIPARLDDVPDLTTWSAMNFTPYLGKTFSETKKAMEVPIRNAIAHISPGMDHRSADDFQDIQECRAAIPVLRYMARILIDAEIVGLKVNGPSTP